VLTRELPQPAALGTHDDHGPARHVDLGGAFVRLRLGPHHPESGLLKVPQAAREVGDDHDRRALGGTGGDFAHGGVRLRGPISRDDDR
jgi:hypothetical protein